MYPYIHLILPSYSVMAFIGGFVTLIYLYFRLEKYQIEFTSFLKIVVLGVIGCLLGSKLLFAVTQIPWLINHFTFENLIFLIPNSGLVFYGGLFGVIFTLSFYSRKDTAFKEKLFQMTVPAFPLFHAFGRIGCLFAGCCYGKELDSPIVIGNIIQFSEIPIPIFESVFEFVIFAILNVIEKRNTKCDLLKVYLISYAIFRFINEFFRGDTVRGIFFGLSTSQWVSLAILCFYLLKHDSKKIQKSSTN